MPRRIDLTGKTFGKLTVLDSPGSNRHGSLMWRARCACGRVVEVDGQHLRKGAVISCGCSKLAPRDAMPPAAVRGARWIALGGGGHTLVDAQDADLATLPWHLHEGYAVRYEKRKIVRMHRVIAARAGLLVPGKDIDHRDLDRLNNRRANLRPCTRGQNLMNNTGRVGSSSFKGVTKLPSGKWMAQINADGQHHYLGAHPTPEAAARAYNEAAQRLHGAFARLNEV